MKKYDVIIVGAGFAGITCAKVLADHGFSVLVLERRKDIGKGLHTTGILVDEAHRILPLPSALSKPIRQVRLYSSSMRHIEVKSDHYVFYATDTPELMRYLVQEASTHGVEFLFGTPFLEGKDDGGRITVNNGLASARLLIGADGAKSAVAQAFNLGRNHSFLLGVEAEYSGVTMENPDAFYCFINQRLAKGYIGWAIPGPKVMQIGLATCLSERPDIEQFYRYILPVLRPEKPEIVERRGGLIPVGGLVRPFYHDRVILVGDAAGIVSPLTAGGIHTALYYGQRLGNLLAAYFRGEGNHPGKILAAEYPRFRAKLLLRKAFNHIPNWGFNALVASPVSQPLADAIFFLKKRLPKQRHKTPERVWKRFRNGT